MGDPISKILIIVDSIDINDSSASKGRVALIHNLAKLGYNLKVLHYTKKEIILQSIDCVYIPELKYTANYFLSRFQRVFTRITGIKVHSFLENLFGFSFTFFNDVASIKKAMLKESNFNPDLIITLSKGASFRPHYAMLKLPQFHHIWMAYVHDPYPFHFYPRPYNWVEPGYKQKEIFFRKMFSDAYKVAFPSQLLQTWMASYFLEISKKAVIIPHQITNFKFDTKAPSFFDSSKFTLLHAGNLMNTRNPQGLIEGFNIFLNKNEEAKNESQLLLIGNLAYFKNNVKEAQKQIPNLYLSLENLPFEQIYILQQQVAVNIILESDTEISPFLPGKFPHCVEANKIILLLGPYYSETKRLLKEDYKYWAESIDANKIAVLLEDLYLRWKNNDLELNRSDLNYYLSKKYLKQIIDNLLNPL